jgi:hypothetical protein
MIEENKRAFSNKIPNQIESKKYRQRFNRERRIIQIKVEIMINQVDAYHHWETSAGGLNALGEITWIKLQRLNK